MLTFLFFLLVVLRWASAIGLNSCVSLEFAFESGNLSPLVLKASLPHSGPNNATNDAPFVYKDELYFQKTSVAYSVSASN